MMRNYLILLSLIYFFSACQSAPNNQNLIGSGNVIFGAGTTNTTSYVYGVMRPPGSPTFTKIFKRTLNASALSIESTIICTTPAATFTSATGPGYLAILSEGRDGAYNQVYLTLVSGTTATQTKITTLNANSESDQMSTFSLGNVWYDISSAAFFYTYGKKFVTITTPAVTTNTVWLGGMYVNGTAVWSTPLFISIPTAAKVITDVMGSSDNWTNSSNLYVAWKDITASQAVTYYSKTAKTAKTATTAGLATLLNHADDLLPISTSQYLDIDINTKAIVNQDKSEHFTYGGYRFENLIRPGWYGRLSKGTQLSTGKEVALKINAGNGNEKLVRTLREAEVMQSIQGAPNTIPYLETFQALNRQKQTVYIIAMGFFRGDEFLPHIDKMNASAVKYVMYQLLRTISYANERSIYHGDINTGNILINNKTLELVIIDWGEAKTYPRGLPARKNSDVNELGGHMLTMVLGSAGIPKEKSTDMMNEYKNRVRTGNSASLNQNGEKKPWDKFIQKYHLSSVDPQVWSLLDQMLRIDHPNLLKAHEALEHPYFNSVRGQTTFSDKIEVKEGPKAGSLCCSLIGNLLKSSRRKPVESDMHEKENDSSPLVNRTLQNVMKSEYRFNNTKGFANQSYNASTIFEMKTRRPSETAPQKLLKSLNETKSRFRNHILNL